MKNEKKLAYALIVSLVILIVVVLPYDRIKSSGRNFQKYLKLRAEERKAKDILEKQRQENSHAIASINEKLSEWTKYQHTKTGSIAGTIIPV